MKISQKITKTIFALAVFFILFSAQGASAVSFGDSINFYVDENFDASARTQVAATLVKTTPKLYLYIEKNWWDSQIQAKQNDLLSNLDRLSQEFDSRIYPILTSVFGSEWKPGVDGDERITILFQSLKAGAGGYFREADEYIKLQIPDSNEKEMLYLPVSQIDNSQLKVFLAHEFVHLITFNQKNRILNTEEEVWLNEARADYSSNILGYDSQYQGSNLQRRVQAFLEKPSDPLTEWQETKYDYGVVSLFTHYLVDHYGINILIDSLKSKYAGIESLNYALHKNGVEEDFSQIFTNWTIAIIINNCSADLKYCYLNQNLKNLRIAPALNFLPLTGNVSLSVSNVTKNWAGNWLKFIGGNGDMALDFSSLTGLNFTVPYIIEDSGGTQAIKYLSLDENEKGEMSIENFGTDYKSLVIIPSLQTKISGFDGLEPTYPYTYSIEVKGEVNTGEDALIQQLLEKIVYLRAEIARLLGQKSGGANVYCSQINNSLSFGTGNSSEVKCLQQFLKDQGADIYPEGLVTGNFATLTRAAVIRFQERYASEILSPIGLSKGTGYVGIMTRQKINQILGGA